MGKNKVIGKYHDQLVALGLVIGTKEWNSKRRILAYQDNIEVERERNKIFKRDRLKKLGREQVNAIQRDRYRASRSKYWDTIREGRIRRNPAYGLEKAVRDFERGLITYDELDRLYSNRLARINERNVQKG